MEPDIILMAIINIVVYFLPSIVGFFAGHSKINLIFKINLFAGWTIVGWLVAIFMVLSKEE